MLRSLQCVHTVTPTDLKIIPNIPRYLSHRVLHGRHICSAPRLLILGESDVPFGSHRFPLSCSNRSETVRPRRKTTATQNPNFGRAINGTKNKLLALPLTPKNYTFQNSDQTVTGRWSDSRDGYWKSIASFSTVPKQACGATPREMGSTTSPSNKYFSK
jgi:hypothetical protein